MLVSLLNAPDSNRQYLPGSVTLYQQGESENVLLCRQPRDELNLHVTRLL